MATLSFCLAGLMLILIRYAYAVEQYAKAAKQRAEAAEQRLAVLEQCVVHLDDRIDERDYDHG
jgi:hypothetical protein